MTFRPRSRSRHAAAAARPARRSGAGGTLIGLFIGIAIGLALAAGVAFYVMKAGNPYQPATAAREPARETGRDASRTVRSEQGAAEKPRFDFYKILPGIEEPKAPPKSAEKPAPDKLTVDRAAAPDKPGDRSVAKQDERLPTAPKSPDRFWLQAGSFAAEPDAENLKARLALAGWEAVVQAANVSEKGVRYRVRLGPYDNTDELNRIKGELGKRGFDVAVIKF
jgi:cell division protein FtsN